jgi:hypothetical protein
VSRLARRGISAAACVVSLRAIAEPAGKWLRGLDSNQDIQLQRLACYRLHHPGSGLPCSTYWRRGWDSNPEPPIKTRNLLISIAYQDARTARNAGVGYKRGTKNVSPEKRSLAVPENLFYAHCCAQVSNTAYCIPPQFRPVRFRGPDRTMVPLAQAC